MRSPHLQRRAVLRRGANRFDKIVSDKLQSAGMNFSLADRAASRAAKRNVPPAVAAPVINKRVRAGRRALSDIRDTRARAMSNAKKLRGY